MNKLYFVISIIMFICLTYINLNYKIYKEPFSNSEKNNVLWSKAVDKVTKYNLLNTEESVDIDILKNHVENSENILWIRNTSCNDQNKETDLNLLSKNLDIIKEPVILVTSDGDRSVPSSYNKDVVNNILESDKIIKWYTQNYDKTLLHSKLDYYPIGLDLHTLKWLNKKDSNNELSTLREEKIKLYLELNDKFKNNKLNKIFCDSHLSVTHPSRGRLYDLFKNNKHVKLQNERVDYDKILSEYAKHRFVLSPRGNGIDCHRTWEIFLLGSIVITESSSLDKMYIDNNLPVIIVNKFEELNNVDNDKLLSWYKNNIEKTNKKNILDKFNPLYWCKKHI